MGKRKEFIKTDFNTTKIGQSQDATGNVVVLPETVPPTNTIVEFGRNASSNRTFDFARWYGTRINSITNACQRQIERFLDGRDGARTPASVSSYCLNGLRNFLEYCVLHSTDMSRDLTLADVNRDLIDGYIYYLASHNVSASTQKTRYTHTKAVLIALGQRKIIPLVNMGDTATFPRNPFPNTNRKIKGETPLSKSERQAFAVALRQAIQPIWAEDIVVTSELLIFALLIVALHTGRNTTPLLEMSHDCLSPHPKDNTVFLVLWKRRGYNTSKVALRGEPEIERLLESTPSVKSNVERLIRRVMQLTWPLNAEAPLDLKGRVWLYRSRESSSAGKVTALNTQLLGKTISRFVIEHNLHDSNGDPLRLNISRLRKTFANRIFELSDGDLATTATALGNTARVADQNYLVAGENARRNWQFMGQMLIEELLTQTISATYKNTPTGRCNDPLNGEYAPKHDGKICMNFMNCLRCKHYAVTSEDLYKLFSFYFRVLDERSRMDKQRWAREYAHIPRLIDHYIIAEGLRRGIFNAAHVKTTREHARNQPHSFWSVDFIDDLEILA